MAALIDRLIPWKRLIAAARIAPDTARGLTRSAKNAGADPFFWYGALVSIPVAECRVQQLDGDVWVAAHIGAST